MAAKRPNPPLFEKSLAHKHGLVLLKRAPGRLPLSLSSYIQIYTSFSFSLKLHPSRFGIMELDGNRRRGERERVCQLSGTNVDLRAPFRELPTNEET